MIFEGLVSETKDQDSYQRSSSWSNGVVVDRVFDDALTFAENME